MRINKYLSDLGICSRRKADEWVKLGRITLRGRRAVLGDEVNDGDLLCLDGKEILAQQKKPVLLAYNKPRGVECTANPDNPDNIIKAVDYPERIYNVGRLDKFSEGLILLTNVGEVAHRLTHAKFGFEKEYLVETAQELSKKEQKRISEGMPIGDENPTAPCKIVQLNKTLYRIVLKEGRNRQIRRMVESFENNHVKKLQRVRVGPIVLGNLKVGEWRALAQAECDEILKLK